MFALLGSATHVVTHDVRMRVDNAFNDEPCLVSLKVDPGVRSFASRGAIRGHGAADRVGTVSAALFRSFAREANSKLAEPPAIPQPSLSSVSCAPLEVGSPDASKVRALSCRCAIPTPAHARARY